MIYYLTCFALSSFFLWLGDKIKREQVGFKIGIFTIALLIPAILAGIRDVSVGTDVMVYAYPIFKDAYYAPSFSSLVQQWNRIELGYLSLNYMVSGLTSSHNVFLGLIMFLEVLFTFLVLRQWKDKIPTWLGMLIFYFLFFNSSMNLMRQSLALSIAFLSIRYIFERKLFLFFFWVLISCLFHKSMLIFILYYPFFLFTNKFPSLKYVLLFIATGILSIIVGQQLLADYMASLGDVGARAGVYITTIEKAKFPLNTMMFYALPFVLFLYNRRLVIENFPKERYMLQYLSAMLIFMPFLDFYGGIYAYRFFPLLTWWLFILIPITFYSFQKYPKYILNLAIISYCLFSWFYNVIYMNANETADYLTIFK